MSAALERLVRDRAGGRCEYCRLPRAASRVPFQVDHIIARKHNGRTIASNLAISCIYCNAYKGPNISGIDPATGRLEQLLFEWTGRGKGDWLRLYSAGACPPSRRRHGRREVALTRLFHPRRHKWSAHFRYQDGALIGRTSIGRATIQVLNINLPTLIALREILMARATSRRPCRRREGGLAPAVLGRCLSPFPRPVHSKRSCSSD